MRGAGTALWNDLEMHNMAEVLEDILRECEAHLSTMTPFLVPFFLIFHINHTKAPMSSRPHLPQLMAHNPPPPPRKRTT
jgi:hypothetical protein